jgi:hypothetical protein
MADRPLIDLAGDVRGETDRAYYFNDGTRMVWLPKSQCQWDQSERVLTLPEWLAREKELI